MKATRVFCTFWRWKPAKGVRSMPAREWAILSAGMPQFRKLSRRKRLGARKRCTSGISRRRSSVSRVAISSRRSSTRWRHISEDSDGSGSGPLEAPLTMSAILRAVGARLRPVLLRSPASSLAVARSVRVCLYLKLDRHSPQVPKSISWQIEASACTRWPKRGHCSQ